MKTYYFVDKDTEEEFFVETDNKEKAYTIAYTYFKEPKFISEVTYEFAECAGLDTY